MSNMLHNNELEIVKLFLGDYSAEMYGRGMVGKIRMSHKNIALVLDTLEKKWIVHSRQVGRIRYYSLNTANPILKDVIIMGEISKKIGFFEKYPKIAQLFKHDDRIVGVFGSYARSQEKKDSDVDLFVIGKKMDDDYDKEGSIFGSGVSVKYFSENEWKTLLKMRNNLCKEIIKNHLIIFGFEQFIDRVWRGFYGFD